MSSRRGCVFRWFQRTNLRSSLVPPRQHWINAAGTTCGQPAGGERNHHQNTGGSDERREIAFGPIGAGPGKMAQVSAKGVVGEPQVEPRDGDELTFALTIPVGSARVTRRAKDT